MKDFEDSTTDLKELEWASRCQLQSFEQEITELKQLESKRKEYQDKMKDFKVTENEHKSALRDMLVDDSVI